MGEGTQMFFDIVTVILILFSFFKGLQLGSLLYSAALVLCCVPLVFVNQWPKRIKRNKLLSMPAQTMDARRYDVQMYYRDVGMSTPSGHSIDDHGNMYTHYEYHTYKQPKRLEITVWPENSNDTKIVLHSLPGIHWKELYEISASMDCGFAGHGRFCYVTDKDGKNYFMSFTKLEEGNKSIKTDIF